MILSLQQGLVQEGFKVSLVKLCLWFQMPRRTMYYRSTKAQPKVQESPLNNARNPHEDWLSGVSTDGRFSQFDFQ